MRTARGQGTGHRPVPQGRFLPAIQIIIDQKKCNSVLVVNAIQDDIQSKQSAID